MSSVAKNSVRPVRSAAVRDPERTRERILAAALQEFSAQGLSGARVDRIAQRAAINKRMLYHYFGNKRDLFREVLHHKLADRTAWMTDAPDDTMEIMPYWFNLIRNDHDWIRLLEWEALQHPAEEVVNEKERQRSFARAIKRVRRGQRRGLLAKGIDPRHMVLSTMALITFPLAFPQLTRLVTGRRVTDPQFQQDRIKFLTQLADIIRMQAKGGRGDSAGKARVPEGKTPKEPHVYRKKKMSDAHAPARALPGAGRRAGGSRVQA